MTPSCSSTGRGRTVTCSANGIALHVAEMGSGPLVLLLHGFPQFWWTWRQQLVDLADSGYRAVAVDLRGYGASDKPPRGYDTPTLAADIAALVTALGERDAMVVGNDVGGLLAWTMAAMHPRVVRRLAVLGAAHPLRLRAGHLLGSARAGPCVRLRAARLPATPSAGIATHQGRDLRPATVRHLVRSALARLRRPMKATSSDTPRRCRSIQSRTWPSSNFAGSCDRYPVRMGGGSLAACRSRLPRRSCTCTVISIDAFSRAPLKAQVAT